jgi:sugar phosphate isomerase/epimerase
MRRRAVGNDEVRGLNGRRTFLSMAARAVAGAVALPAVGRVVASEPPAVTYGLQLFTLFDIIDADVHGTLQAVARIGYRDLQSSYTRLGGIYGMTPRAFGNMVGDLGMRWSSHHVPGVPRKGKPMAYPRTLNLRDDMQEVIDKMAEGGPRYLVCAGVPCDTLDEVHASIALLSRAGQTCRKAGLTLALHNHEAEFRRLGDTTPYELILNGVDADLLTMELDIGWAVKAGVDPVGLFNLHPGRFGLWHVKDMQGRPLQPVPLGQGVIDFRRIFAHADSAGMQHYYVEHDSPADPMASIATSLQYLKRMFDNRP